MDAKTKFTPGPWHADGPDMFGDFNILHPADSLAVAAAVTNLRPPEEVHANACLLAAAPTMYAALKRQQENIRRWIDTGIAASPEESRAISDAIDAALAEADGEA